VKSGFRASLKFVDAAGLGLREGLWGWGRKSEVRVGGRFGVRVKGLVMYRFYVRSK
jgi:hypothetical protein